MEDGNILSALLDNLEAILLFKGKTLSATLLLLSINVPLLFSLILLAVGDISERFIKGMAMIGFFVPVLIAGWLWAVIPAAETFGSYAFYSDTPTGLENFGISLKIGLNGISMPLFMLAAVVGVAAGIYAIYSKADRMRHYLMLLLLMQGGLMGVFASVDIFFFYFFHEIALIPTFIMIAYWGGKGRRPAAMELAIYLTLGAMLSLLGLLAIYVKSGLGSFDIITLKDHLGSLSFSMAAEKYIYGFLLFGFGILVSLWPFHSWAPRGYGAAPTPVAMLHAGVLKKFGLYGLIQIAAPLLPHGAAHWNGLLVWLALGNIIIIGLVTISQRDLKQMIGYSSVMHMGYVFLGIACFSAIGTGGAVMLMFAHGLSVALLFMLSTCIYHRSQTFEMNEMGGLAKKTPVLAAFFVAGTLASVGLPGFANFWGEIAIFIGLWEFQPWLVIPAIAGIVISAIYGLRAAALIFFGPATPAMEEATAEREIEDLHLGEKTPAVILLVALFLIGFWPRLISEGVNEELSEIYPETRSPAHVQATDAEKEVIFTETETEEGMMEDPS